MNSKDGNSREGQMMLYQITVSDLTYFKSQQWSIANHAFLLLAGLIGTSQLIQGNARHWERVALTALALLIVLASQLLLTKLQDSIVVRQARLDAAREKLGLEFYESWAAKDKKREYIHSIWIIRGAILIGGTITCWILLRSLAG